MVWEQTAILNGLYLSFKSSGKHVNQCYWIEFPYRPLSRNQSGSSLPRNGWNTVLQEGAEQVGEKVLLQGFVLPHKLWCSTDRPAHDTRFVTRRFAFCHFTVPFFWSLKVGINIDDYPPVIKTEMMDDLSNTEFAESVHMIYWGNIFKFNRSKTWSLISIVLSSRTWPGIQHNRLVWKGNFKPLHWIPAEAGMTTFSGGIKGRVENRVTPALPHQTVHTVFPYTAFRYPSSIRHCASFCLAL